MMKNIRHHLANANLYWLLDILILVIIIIIIIIIIESTEGRVVNPLRDLLVISLDLPVVLQ
jgi:uncharacterized membrane-anchored protein